MATPITPKPDDQSSAISPTEIETERNLGEKRSHDATLNVLTEGVYSKFKWGNANDSSSYGQCLYFHIEGHENPLVLNFDEEIILGRLNAKENQLPVVDLTPYGGVEKGVSRTHAVIQRMKNSVVLVDLGSVNKTFINGQRLASYQPHILVEGDEIRLGNLVATISYRQRQEAKR